MACSLVLYNLAVAIILLVSLPVVKNYSCAYGYNSSPWGCLRAIYRGDQKPGRIITAFGLQKVVTRPPRKPYTLPHATTVRDVHIHVTQGPGEHSEILHHAEGHPVPTVNVTVPDSNANSPPKLPANSTSPNPSPNPAPKPESNQLPK